MNNIPVTSDKIKAPAVLERFIDDDASDIPDEPDEYVAGGGDPPRSGQHVDGVDREDMFKKIVGYSSIKSKRVEFLCGETMVRDSNEERQLREIVESGVKYNFTGWNQSHANQAVKDNPCTFCEAGMYELSIKDKDPNDPSPFVAAKRTDLKLCGWMGEPYVIQAVTNVFNETEQNRAFKEKRPPKTITSSETRTHLYHHDISNPKRAVVLDMIRTNHLSQSLYEASMGVTADRERVIRTGLISAYNSSASRASTLSADLIQRSMFVNVNMLGEDPYTGESNLQLRTAGAGGAGTKRHAGPRIVNGKKKKMTCD